MYAQPISNFDVLECYLANPRLIVMLRQPLLPRFGPSVWFLSSGFMTIIFSLSLFHIITEEDIKDPEQVRHTFSTQIIHFSMPPDFPSVSSF